ncbi:hypothetical protein [Halarchaeum sp. P4]|uniref:hypothetical protein n=1 Tax=Halarchaeum sp. P4 TaxID=3421639 RepID=UPI003EBA397F
MGALAHGESVPVIVAPATDAGGALSVVVNVAALPVVDPAVASHPTTDVGVRAAFYRPRHATVLA